MSFLINNISKYLHERFLILSLLIICFISCLFLIPISFFYDEIHFTQFFLFFSILFISSNILESVGSSLLAKIIPFQNGGNINKYMNPGLTIILTTTGGRFFGSLLITIFGFYFGYDHIQFVLFSFLLFFNILLCTLIWTNIKELRVKAISRIIKKTYFGPN
jgi:hypothetical protein